MTLVFLCGALSQGPLLQAILGQAVAAKAVVWPGQAGWITPGAGQIHARRSKAGGIVGDLTELTPQAMARLAFYAKVMGYRAKHVDLVEGRALAYLAPREQPAEPWRNAAQLPDYTAAVAADVMALFGKRPAQAVSPRLGAMAVRASSRVRALAAPVAAQLRRGADVIGADVAVARFQQPYAHFFAVEEYDLSYRKFSGEMSRNVNRAIFISGDAVTVLPYDPQRDRVLLVEQFRAGLFARGDRNPWSLEAIAGRIDAGETPEQAARREAIEEAGLELGALLPLASCYPSPGAKAEFLYNYIALCDLPDGVEGVFGLDEEAEDIRGHLISRDELMALIATGEISNGPLILSALWLDREAARLRGG